MAKKKKTSNQVPLKVLEERLKKLGNVVARRKKK